VGITAPLRARPFFTGTSTSSTLVPYRYPVSLDGRPYMIDTVLAEEWRHETVPLLRQQSDSGTAPGEESLNPEGLWRRSWTSWHKGAGQINRDREDSSPFRFRESRGIDVWDRYELSLLPDVDQKHTSSNTNLKMVVAGNRLFLVDGAAVTYTEDITAASPTWTACTNEPGGTILDITTDGEYVWITDGAVSVWADASASPPAFNLAGWTGTQDADVLAFVKGRLMSAHDGEIHTYDAAGAATAVAMTAVRLPTTWTCVGFAAGPTNSVIYAAGFVGDKSTILRVGIKEDGSGLDAAIVAGELPDGEIVRSIGTYLGFVLLGTDTGVRFATPNESTGDLTIGALLETGSPCRCFEGQGPHVWFGWDQFVESSSPGSVLTGENWHGLGRLSLEEFSFADRLAPAYATDLMTSDTVGQVSSVVTFQGRRVWTIEGTDLGVYGEEATPGASGYLLAGLVDFGFTGLKTALEVELAFTNPASGEVGFQVEVDDTGAFSPALSVTAADAGVQSFPVGPLRGSRFDVLVALTRGGTTSPTLTSYTLKASPAAEGTVLIQVPLLLNEHLDPDGGVEYLDVEEERNAVIGWWETRQPITYKEFSRTHEVTVEDYRWVPRIRGDSSEGFAVDGTMILKLKVVS
jgi:hypothetical protein